MFGVAAGGVEVGQQENEHEFHGGSLSIRKDLCFVTGQFCFFSQTAELGTIPGVLYFKLLATMVVCDLIR